MYLHKGDERLNLSSLSLGTRQGCLFSLLLFNSMLEILAISIKQKKETKVIQIDKEEIKLSLFPDYMIICTVNPPK